MIKNKASINEESSGSMDNLKKEIKRLKEELLLAQSQIQNLSEDKKDPNNNNLKLIHGSNRKGGDSMLIEDDNQKSIFSSANKRGKATPISSIFNEKQIGEMNQK